MSIFLLPGFHLYLHFHQEGKIKKNSWLLYIFVGSTSPPERIVIGKQVEPAASRHVPGGWAKALVWCSFYGALHPVGIVETIPCPLWGRPVSRTPHAIPPAPHSPLKQKASLKDGAASRPCSIEGSRYGATHLVYNSFYFFAPARARRVFVAGVRIS